MKPFTESSLANASLILLLAIGLALLALLVLSPDFVQARLDGLQPVSLQSGLQANYSADALGLAIQPIELKAVEQAIADRSSSTVSSRQQAAAAIEALNIPVVMVTPKQVQTQPAATSPTSVRQILTNTSVATNSTRPVVRTSTAMPTAFHPNSTATHTAAVTLINPNSTNTPTPDSSTKPALSPTPIQATATLLPTKTPTSTKSVPVATSIWTLLPSRTNTWTVKPPTNTATATPKPPTSTYSPLPSTKTNTPGGYPPPATRTTLHPYP